MNILIAVALCCFMAVFTARGAPLPDRSALVAEPQWQQLVQQSLTLTEKILQGIEDTHKFYVIVKGLTELNSPENAKLETMALTIGIPSAPVLRDPSDNSTLETCLKNISDGLQLHQALLTTISSEFKDKEKVQALNTDIKDLVLQIHKMLKMVTGKAIQASPPTVLLNMSGEYEVQVATHLTLVQLHSFSGDVVGSLGFLDQSNGEDTDR